MAFFEGLTSFLKDNGTALQGLGSLVNGVGNAWGLYQEGKMAKKQFDLQKQAQNFNIGLINRNIQRQDEADENLKNAFANSTYGSATRV